MGGEWKERSIGDLGEVVGGSTPSTKDPANFDGDVPWLTPNDLSGYHERYISRGGRNLSRRGLATCSAQLLPANSVMLSSRAPIGYVAIAANPIATNQGFRSLVLKPEYDHEFLYYWLMANVSELERHASGSTFKELSGSAFKQIRIYLPSDHSEQRAIAHILGTLDDKIELNRRMNETLEEMARALFKSWFVDFDPVRAKAEGRDPGLPLPLADMFSARLVHSEIGEIPDGWEVFSLGSLAKVVKGTSYRSTDLRESDTALVTLKSFSRGGGYRPDGLKSFGGLHKAEQVVVPGELVIACTDITQAAEVVGRPALVEESPRFKTLVASLDALIVRPIDARVSVSFLYSLCRTDAFKDHTYAYTTGTTVLHLAREAVPSFRFAFPSRRVLQAFDQLAASAHARRFRAKREIELLTSLRDSLLPKLISGELRIKHADRHLGRTE